MSYPFNMSDDEAEHVFNMCCGIESLATRMRAGDELKAITGQERYTLAILEFQKVDINDIDGAEGLIQSAARSIVGALDWLGKRYFQYGYIIERWIESKITGVIMRAIYSEKSAKTLASKSLFSPEQIIQVITNPAAEEAKVKKLEATVRKGIEGGRVFDIPQAALYPIISMAKQSKGNGETVLKAVKSAGSVDKLIRKHADLYRTIDVDTSAYVKAYDTLTKSKEATVDSIIAKLDNAEHIISNADSSIKGDVWLTTYPKDLRKNFELTKDFNRGASIVNRIMLKGLLKALHDDVNKLKSFESKLSKSDSEAELKIAHAGKLLKIYSAIIDELMDYEYKVVKAQTYASSVAAEALYKIIIAAAKAEVKE